ncbi:SpoIVB peptidase S55 domain-containing protein [Nocardioides sp. SOB77]|uniref:SpoIVB peptidase S55 domain-containing protein n=1 Tax=Nocardioides oceani TaxID=3058369 RepID=A0ABT8FK52_9ACTN|nr:SpoIVB peptidase S55 domain-containing protein [Nocardioides oceani]MDN4175072.1 SpoIVB peptidase S55 domain-containing protein [Nocardioides oceani]
MTTTRRRGTALVTLTATTGLLLGTAALGAGPATSAEPAGDCTAPFPVSELAEGDAVTGLTVTRGTTPESFTGEVIGVYEDGIGPDLDMVMVEVDMPEVAESGIWQGMSGSPVYAADGRLIGAIAYGLSFGPSPVAGVTPFEDMDDYLAEPAEPPARVPVGKALAGRIAASTDVTRAQAAQGLRQLPMPLGISGVSAGRIAGTEDRPYFTRGAKAAAGGATAAVGPETIVPGGNLAASLSYGDVTQAGVGTVTSVCNGRVVGFGHPMSFEGETTLSLHPASALYVQEDPVGPGFKVANLGAPTGTISEDHLTGITGFLGALPRATTISNTATYDGRTRTGTSKNTVDSAAASTTFYQIVANHDRVLDAIMPGSETMSWTITGTDSDGSSYELGFEDRYASDYDITADAGYELSDLVYALSRIEGVTVDTVTSESVISDDSSSYRVRGVQQQRGGEWVPLGKGEVARAKAGTMLDLRAVLAGPEGLSYLPLAIKVPASAAGMKGRLAVVGGGWTYSGGNITSVAKAEKVVAGMLRNDELQVELSLSKRRKEIEKEKVIGPADRVVFGAKRVRVVVK